MHYRLTSILVAVLSAACGPDSEPETAAIEGEWMSASDLEGADNVLVLDEDGVGEATIYRVTVALESKLTYTLNAEPSEEEGKFDLSFRCEGRFSLCEQHDFDSECWLDDDDRLLCEPPPWKKDPNLIPFTRS